jgi:hypothetical protein
MAHISAHGTRLATHGGILRVRRQEIQSKARHNHEESAEGK